VDNTLCCPCDLFKRYQQVIFRKRTDDLLSNPKADCFLNLLKTDEFILFGVGLESSVKALALALRARGRRTRIVVDACGYWNKSAADLALRQVVAKGVELITVRELLNRKLARGWVDRNGRRSRTTADASTKRSDRHRGRRPSKHRPTKPQRVQNPVDRPTRERGRRVGDGKS
jgi:hypothetical protein